MSSAGGPGGPGSGGAGGLRILAGRYRLEEVIGRGGMSTVYRGTDLSLDRVVAVKVAMDPLLERDPVYASRFKREARATAALSHPGVATVFDAGADGPTRYIVMEYVEGRDLAAILRDERPLDIRRAERIAEQVADTLAAAHAAGIVHRDIKPGNIMVTPQERVKVLDFGIARTTDGVNLTQTASVLGTAPYMAPEQAMGQPADARSDLYSLGCVLYEMLTGRPPFTGDLPAAVLHQHVRVDPKPPSQLNPEVPPALDALVMQLLAKSPDDRPQTAAEVRDRLAGLDAPTGPTKRLPAVEPLVAAPPPTPGYEPTSRYEPTPPGEPTRPPPTPPRRPPSRGSGPWVFLAVVALLLLGGAVAYALASGGSSNSSSSSSSSHSAPPSTESTAAPPSSTSHSTSTPTTTSSTTSASTSTTSTSTTTPTTTVSTTSTSGTTAPGSTTSTPPGQGGTPPGQAKKTNK